MVSQAEVDVRRERPGSIRARLLRMSGDQLLMAYTAAAVAWLAGIEFVIPEIFHDRGEHLLVQAIGGAVFVIVSSRFLGVHFEARDRTEMVLHSEVDSLADQMRLHAYGRDLIFRFRVRPRARVEYISPAVRDLLGYDEAAVRADPRLALRIVVREDRRRLLRSLRTPHELHTTVLRARRASGTIAWLELSGAALPSASGSVGIVEGTIRDITHERLAPDQWLRVRPIIEGASDEVYTIDTRSLHYRDASHGALLNTGYTLSELIALTPSDLLGPIDGDRLASFIRLLQRHEIDRATFDARHVRRDGATYPVRVRLSYVPKEDPPIVVAFVEDLTSRADAAREYGMPQAATAGLPEGTRPIVGGHRDTKTDLALEHAEAELQQAALALERALRERSVVAAALARLRPADTIEETAGAICKELLRIDDVLVAGVLELGPAGEGAVLGLEPADLFGAAAGYRLTMDARRMLLSRASDGPWVEPATIVPRDDPLGAALAAAGVSSLICAPLTGHDGTVGLLIVGSDSRAAGVRRLVLAATEFGALAGALLVPALESREHDATLAAEIRGLIEAEAFSPVFQPVVEFATSVTVGYEALTRFDDGAPAADRFAAARSVGLGVALEQATLRAAIHHARSLPPGSWVGFNVSFELVIAQPDLPDMLRNLGRRALLDIADDGSHGDGTRLRGAVAAFGPCVMLAVGETTLGSAGLRRIADLHPGYVKLGLDFVGSIDRDPVRQALTTGLAFYAREVGSALIAVGIERPEQIEVLSRLGVQFGQGQLLGRPAPARSFLRPAEHRAETAGLPAI